MINLYKKQWIYNKGKSNEYDDCCFYPNKVEFAKRWILNKKEVNFDNPQNVVDLICKEKINLISASYDELKKKQDWSDKISAYDKLHELGLDDLAIPSVKKTRCLRVTEDLFRGLKENETYIIKTNHGSGWNLKFTPGKSNEQYIIDKLNEWLSLNYCYISGYELQYKWIKPGVIIQKLLCDTPMDWSFWCIDGKINGVGLTKKLGKNFEDYIAFTDENGETPEWYIGVKPAMMKMNPSQKKILERMKPIVSKLCDGFKFVRVDLYCVNDKIYFGEMTFTPCSGILDVSYT